MISDIDETILFTAVGFLPLNTTTKLIELIGCMVLIIKKRPGNRNRPNGQNNNGPNARTNGPNNNGPNARNPNPNSRNPSPASVRNNVTQRPTDGARRR